MYENQEQDVAEKIKASIEASQNQRKATEAEILARDVINHGMGSNLGEYCGKVPGPYLTGTSSARRYTRAEMHEKNAADEARLSQRNLSAAQFLRAHPEFETFLDLIRDGAITLY